jgi:hypothetical protein
MADEIVNRVAESGIIQFDLEDWIKEIDSVEMDISEFLFEGFILREKDFRQKIKDFDWSNIKKKTLILSNNDDAIITTWSLMLIASEMEKVQGSFYFGNKTAFLNSYVLNKIQNLNLEEFTDARMIIKGCGNYKLDENLYTQFVLKVQPVVKSIMFGEACSSVPVYKKR